MKNGRVDLNFMRTVDLFELVSSDKETVKRMNETLHSCSVACVIEPSSKIIKRLEEP